MKKQTVTVVDKRHDLFEIVIAMREALGVNGIVVGSASGMWVLTSKEVPNEG